MRKSRARLSRRPSSRSRTKRVIALKRTLANKQTNKPLDHMIIDQSVSSSLLIDMEEMWENTFEQPIPTQLDDVEVHSEDLQNAWGTDEEFRSIMSEQLHVEVVAPENKISGNRIVHLNHLLGTTIRISKQHARSCTAGNLYIDKETRSGLVSTLVYKCNTCEKIFSCTTEDPSAPIINKAAFAKLFLSIKMKCLECVLPEIIRGNLKRGLRCVDPEYIMNAQKYNANTKCKTLASI
ncbi:hypothetical protein QE152_g30614 [Popillia japonica]|uniref:Mutator-like transposase domain-containing protein n=1 Tax=Popillia japonica TaxID=7064 RepID=A0AAW1JDP1_POPJA